MSVNFKIASSSDQQAKIIVVGVGGGGGNAVDYMMESQILGVEFVSVNTDAQVLQHSKAQRILQLGQQSTKGLGAGADPERGKSAALEDKERIAELLDGTDMVFITAGMGGGTGTGAAPVISEIARDQGILTVAVVTKPFSFEGQRRMQVAERGIRDLSGSTDSLIVIPNEQILTELGDSINLVEAFNKANEVLHNAVQGISELITRPGLINVDFADVRTVMSEKGYGLMGVGVASGEDRAHDAAEKAVRSPFLEHHQVRSARGVLVNVTTNGDLLLGELRAIGESINQYADNEAEVVMGTAIDQGLEGKIRVTIVLTGIGQDVGSMKNTVPLSSYSSLKNDPQLKVGTVPKIKQSRQEFTDYNKPSVLRKVRSLDEGQDEDDANGWRH